MNNKINIIQFMPYFPPHKWWVETVWEEIGKYWVKNNFWKFINVVTEFEQKENTSPHPSPLEEREQEQIIFMWEVIWYKKEWYEVLVCPSIEIINNFPVYKFWDKKYWIIMQYLKENTSPQPSPLEEREKEQNWRILTHTRFFLTSFIWWLFAKKNKIKWIHIEHWSSYVKLSSKLKSYLSIIYDKSFGKWIFKKADKVLDTTRAELDKSIKYEPTERTFKTENIIDDIKALNPDIVINDRLDTDIKYMKELKSLNLKVINFEDLGEGAKKADLVVNAIYPEKQVLPKHFFGHDYFILRDEFIYSQQKKIEKEVKNILVTFGGVDPNNYTKKVIETIYQYCQENNIGITVITGFGYEKHDSLHEFPNIKIKENIMNISTYIKNADIVFTSAGRTTYEIASIGTPAIVLAQNERELTHFFASSEYGFLNLGLGYKISSKELYKNFVELVESYENRKYMSELMKRVDLKNGRKRVVKLIQNVIEE